MEDDTNSISLLRKACEEAKIALSSSDETTIIIDWFENESYVVPIRRHTYDDLMDDLVGKTIHCVEQTIKDAKIQKGEITNIVLVSGSTYIPKNRTQLMAFFGREMDTSVNPLHAGILKHI